MILGGIFLFLLYRQNPEVVIFGAVAYLAWKVISSLGAGKNQKPELAIFEKTNSHMQKIQESINLLVRQIAGFDQHYHTNPQENGQNAGESE